MTTKTFIELYKTALQKEAKIRIIRSSEWSITFGIKEINDVLEKCFVVLK
jgi:hypothetical protein